MTLLSLLGGIGLFMILVALYCFKRIVNHGFGAPIIESFIQLLSQAINEFNHRILLIFMQFILISNVIFIGLMWVGAAPLSLTQVISFDLSIIIFGCIIYVMLKFIPHSLSGILSGKNDASGTLNRILMAGFFQTLSFFGMFLSTLFLFFSFFNVQSLLALSSGVLIVSFYYRSAGGAYKAAAEYNQVGGGLEKRILTHPSELLVKTGNLISSIGGYYMDIFGSWLIAIATFIIYVAHEFQIDSILTIVSVPVVQWVLAVICFTGISMLLAVPLAFIRKNKSNIFLDIGYFIIGATFLQLLYFTNQMNLTVFNKSYFLMAIVVALLGMVGIAFFTNYLTSAYHSPIKLICRQAQYGGANILISSFFNGLVGNAIFFIIDFGYINQYLQCTGYFRDHYDHYLCIVYCGCCLQHKSVFSNIQPNHSNYRI